MFLISHAALVCLRRVKQITVCSFWGQQIRIDKHLPKTKMQHFKS